MSAVIEPGMKELREEVARLRGAVDQLSKAQNAVGRSNIYTALAISVPIALALLFGSYSQVSSLRSEMNARFDAIDARFKSVDDRFTAIEKRLELSERNIIARFDDLKAVILTQKGKN